MTNYKNAEAPSECQALSRGWIGKESLFIHLHEYHHLEPMLSDIKKSRAYQEIAQEARQEGMQEGRQEQVRQIAKAMLKKNLSLELIVEITGISQEEILAISKELADAQN